MFLGHFKYVFMESQGCFKSALQRFGKGSFKVVSGRFTECLRTISKVPPGSLKGVSRKFCYCSKELSMVFGIYLVFQGIFMGESLVFQGSFL